jgi:glycosyltransferase involved in cell wall biosynthesis
MEFETPVICYDNLAVREVGGALPLYATDVLTLTQAVERVLSMSKDDLQSLKKRGRQHSRTFSWKATATAILAAVKS